MLLMVDPIVLLVVLEASNRFEEGIELLLRLDECCEILLKHHEIEHDQQAQTTELVEFQLGLFSSLNLVRTRLACALCCKSLGTDVGPLYVRIFSSNPSSIAF
jgi:hypothetical protein